MRKPIETIADLTPDKRAEIELVGQVYKVQTLVDGGIRLTIDLPESAAVEMGRLAYYQINGIAAEITITRHIGTLTNFDYETKKDPERESARVGGRRSTNRRDKREGGG